MLHPEREILSVLKQVGQVQPTPDSTQRAVRRAREVILSVHEASSHRLFWRIIMPTSIAAILVAAVSVLSVLFIHPEASAVEVLKEVAAVNGAYKGWIHAKADQLPASEQIGPGVAAASMHINTQKQIYVGIEEHGNDRRIEWGQLSEKTCLKYTSANNELILDELPSTLPPSSILGIQVKGRKDLRPEELTGFLVAHPTMDTITALVDYGCTVTRRDEGTYEWFDLTMPKAKEAKPFLTVLFDKKTRLLQRWSGTGTSDGSEAAFSYTYGEPNWQSIYDLGVPKDAKVIDRRTPRLRFPQARAILDRLDGRVGINEKLGDYIAIETETALVGANKPRSQAVVIYGRSGDKRFLGRYTKLSEGKLNLAGWPAPGLALVHSAQEVKPDMLFVYDGTQRWIIRADGTFQDRVSDVSGLESFLLSGAIWPCYWRINHQNPKLTVDVQALNDGPNPGLKMIVTGNSVLAPELGFDGIEEQWRLDPARDDMPMASSCIWRAVDGTVTGETQTRYLEHAQLPAGPWYPTRWVVTMPLPGQVLSVEHRLQIFAGQRLDPVWFTDPKPRFAKP
ncbi:MAG: hypothetical protein ACM359_12630 [Bacillota bacterium]